ncbi:hypothetical protein ABPG77_004315 [Micractinium sp. CCAP 211/92]
MPVGSYAWPSRLTRLRELELGSKDAELRCPPGISRLQCLEELTLRGSRVDLGGARLPPSLGILQIHDNQTTELPHQVAQLSALWSLDLVGRAYTASSLNAISKLGSLQDLLLNATAVPPCLSQLTKLRRLAICGNFEHALPALPHLSKLRYLLGTPKGSFPAAVARLPRLQRVCLWESNLGGTLPAGPWLDNLQWFRAPWALLEAGAGTLAAARQLEYLCAMFMPTTTGYSEDGRSAEDDAGRAAAQRWAAFWDFAATHPPLRCLGIDTTFHRCHPRLERATPSVALLDALVRLKHRRPGLHLRRTPQGGGTGFWVECADWKSIPAGPG